MPGMVRLPVATAAVLAALAVPARAGVLYEGDSAYSHITVKEEGGERCLYFGRNRNRAETEGIQSCIRPDRPDDQVFEYVPLMFAGLSLAPSPRRVLLVGLGGGIVAGLFARHLPKIALDVVEVDERVVELARRHFGFADRSGQRVFAKDARVFVRGAKEKYDLVFLDAFLTDYIPFHLMTAEFLRQVRALLAPGGAVVANVHFLNALYDAELRTYEEVFPGEVHVFKGRDSGNAMIAAAPGTARRNLEALLAGLASGDAAKALPFDVAAQVGKLDAEARSRPGAPVLTDDRAPVHSLQHQPRSP